MGNLRKKYTEEEWEELGKRAETVEYVDYELQRLYDWLVEEDRRPANIAFTSGILRNVAREIEFKLNIYVRLREERNKLRGRYEKESSFITQGYIKNQIKEIDKILTFYENDESRQQ